MFALSRIRFGGINRRVRSREIRESRRPRLELLETRSLPSFTFSVHFPVDFPISNPMPPFLWKRVNEPSIDQPVSTQGPLHTHSPVTTVHHTSGHAGAATAAMILVRAPRIAH